MKFKKIKLPRGGTLYYVKNRINSSTAVEVNFDCGSRCNTIDGLAHFVEHMFFTGTKTMTKEDVAKKYFDFIDVNASTGLKGIRFEGKVFTHELGDYLNTVATMITESTFSQANVNKEIPVVCQEIAGKKDKYKLLSAWAVDYLTFRLPEFKNGNLGTQKSVQSIKSKDVKEYVKKYFVSNNMEVFVATPYSLRKTKKLVVKNLESKLPENKDFEKLPFYYHDIADTHFYSVQTKDIPKSYIYVNFLSKHGRFDFDFKFKFGLVLDMLNDYSEGILNALRLKKSLVYSAGIMDSYYQKNSVVGFSTECDKENVNEILKTLADYFKFIVKNGFTQEQLNKAKRLYEYNEQVKEARVSHLISRLYQIKKFGKVLDAKKIKKTVQETTLHDCNKLFCEIFKNPTVSLLVYGNATKQEVMSKEEFNNLFKSDCVQKDTDK